MFPSSDSMKVQLVFPVGLFIGCSEKASSTTSAKRREIDWAIRNLPESTAIPESSVAWSSSSITVATSSPETTGTTSTTLSPARVSAESTTTQRPLSIVNLAARPISFIRKSYQMYIREEIMSDRSTSILEKFNAYGIPILIDRYLDSPTQENSIIRDIILLVSSELLATRNLSDTSGNSISELIAPICSHLNQVVPFSRDRNVPQIVSDKFRFVLENYPLSNLDFACPNLVISDVEIAYAVVVQKIYREAILGPMPEGGAASWTISKLENMSEEALLSAGLNFMSLIRSDRLRLGFQLPQSGTVSIREWFDRYIFAIFGSNANVDKETDFFPQLGGRVSASKFKAVGKFLAIAILEMEPIGIFFSNNLREMLLGKLQPIAAAEQALCRGFHSIIPVEKLGIFDAEIFGALLLGRAVTAWDVKLYIPHNPLLAEHLSTKRPEIVSEWATKAAGKRGVAIGHFGPLFELFITPGDTEDLVVTPGGRITIPQRVIDELVAEM